MAIARLLMKKDTHLKNTGRAILADNFIDHFSLLVFRLVYFFHQASAQSRSHADILINQLKLKNSHHSINQLPSYDFCSSNYEP